MKTSHNGYFLRKELLIMQNLGEITSKEEAHEWSVHNAFLFGGYRKNFSSTRSTMRSAFMRHNELMNIWTHFLGALLFLFLILFVAINFTDTKELYYQLKSDLRTLNLTETVDRSSERAWRMLKHGLRELNFANKIAKEVVSADVLRAFVHDFKSKITNGKDFKSLSNEESELRRVFNSLTNVFFEKLNSDLRRNATSEAQRWRFYMRNIYTFDLETLPIVVFLFSALFCLLCSAIYHLFCDMNPAVSNRLRSFDYAGVSILISGSCFSIIYYALYCRTTLIVFYSTCIFASSFAVFAISLREFIHRPENALRKSLMYATLGLLNIFPILHMFYLGVWPDAQHSDLPFNAGLVLVVVSGLAYLLGLFIYTHRFPERYYPLTFDIWMNSHVIWHLCVLAGAVIHFAAVVVVYHLRALSPCR